MKAGKKTKAFPLAVYAMVIGAFAVGADEFIVAGVIREIANALSVTIGQAGLLESAYALGVAIGAPLFTVLGLRLPRRRMLLISIGVFVVGNLISALGPTYSVIMVGRLVAASAHGAFLGIAALAAGDLVTPERKGRAIATVFSGLTAATVLGAPIGAAVGRALGWRFTFWTLVLAGAVALLALVFLMPRRQAADHADDGEHAGGHAGHGEHEPHAAHAEAHGHGHAHGHGDHGDAEELDAHARMHMAQEGQRAPLGEQVKALARDRRCGLAS